MASQATTFLARAVERMLNRINVDNPNTPALPPELINTVLDHAGMLPEAYRYTHPRQTSADGHGAQEHPASTPPRNGACLFLQLPRELRREIFGESLLAKDVEIMPRCNDDGINETVGERPAKHNHTSDLMLISKTIQKEVATTVYEKRKFVIHVHEGFKGGIEFLNAGRQPLQYHEDCENRRFEKFKQGEDFGFDRLKHIRITIFPSEESTRLVSMNTYFMNSALVRLLERSEGKDRKNRITNLTVDFAPEKERDPSELVGRRAIMNGVSYWWDSDKDVPRDSWVHALSNVQLVLLPFSRLRSHNVNIELPDLLRSHVDTVLFVSELEARIKSDSLADFIDDRFLVNLETMRGMYDDHVFDVVQGTEKGCAMERKLTEAGAEHNEQDGEKRSLSPTDSTAGGDEKRHKRSPIKGRKNEKQTHEVEDGGEIFPYVDVDSSDDEKDEDLQRTLLDSTKVQQPSQRSVERWNTFAKQESSPYSFPNTLKGTSDNSAGVQARADLFTGQGHAFGSTTKEPQGMTHSSAAATLRQYLFTGQGRTLGSTASGLRNTTVNAGPAQARHDTLAAQGRTLGGAAARPVTLSDSGAPSSAAKAGYNSPGRTLGSSPSTAKAAPAVDDEAASVWKAAGAASVQTQRTISGATSVAGNAMPAQTFWGGSFSGEGRTLGGADARAGRGNFGYGTITSSRDREEGGRPAATLPAAIAVGGDGAADEVAEEEAKEEGESDRQTHGVSPAKKD